MFILSIGSNILFAVWQAIRAFIGVIVAALYGYIVDLYNVFMVISRINILDDKYIKAIYNRVGMILGLFMLFKLSFSLIQSLIDPNKFTDKKNGFASIIYRCVIAIVLLGITPSIFRFARSFQNLIVGADDSSNNVLYRVIVADDIVYPVSSFGQRIATDMFFSFFREDENRHYDEGLEVKEIDNGTALVVKNYATLKEDSYSGKISFDELVPYLSLKDGGQYVFKWDIILSVVVGVAILWILINYCISIATRVIQLAYLQLVAPVPILSYIGNPEGSFKNWVKQCTRTYLDLFIRLAILYFIITLSGKVLKFFEDSNALSNYGIESGSMKFVLVKIFLILGLLMFGKRVPELLKELFPGDGKFDFGVKSPKKLFSEIPGSGLAKKGVTAGVGIAAGAGLGVVGAGISGISRFRSNRANGKSVAGSLFGGAYGVGAGLFKGVKSGFTKKGVSGGWKNIQEANNKYNQLITSGGSTLGTVRAKFGDVLGESKGQEFTRLMANYQKIIDDNKYVNDVAENFSEIKKLKTRWETLRMNGSASEADINAAFDTYKSAKKAALNAALNNATNFTYDETRVVGGRSFIVSGGGMGNLSSYEDAAFSGQIQVRANDAEDFVNSHNVKLVDSSGAPITSFKSADDFKDASVSASKHQTEILSENDFGAAIANDAAAGVDSNRTARKDK